MEKIAIGQIRTSHGVKGYLKVHSFSGFTEHFFKLKEIVLRKNKREKAFIVEKVKRSGNSVLFKLKDIDTPEEGKMYSGWEIWVDEAYGVPLGPEEYYIRDMIGCDVIFCNRSVGTVREVMDNNANDLLEVESVNGSFIVPFMKEFIGAVDVEKGTIELKDDRFLV